MATRANREAYSAMGKVVGGCAAMGTCFSIVDTVRNPTPHNFISVGIFGFASWALLAMAVRIKRSSFPTSAAEPTPENVVGWAIGTPPWIRPVVWIGSFLVLLALACGVVRYRAELRLPVGALKLIFTVGIGVYLLVCQRLDTLVRSWLRQRYPDKPQVAISATGLWVAGTNIPWSSIQAITRRKRSFKLINVDTIVVRAQSGLTPENIEIDLSDSVEDADALYAKLQSAAAAHGAPLQPSGRELRKEVRTRLQHNHELLRQAREQSEQRRAKLPEEIANTEAQIEAVKSRIVQSKTRISELEAGLAHADPLKEQRQKNLELTRANLQVSLRLLDSLERLLQTQRKAHDERR